jgi:hypothetical protein
MSAQYGALFSSILDTRCRGGYIPCPMTVLFSGVVGAGTEVVTGVGEKEALLFWAYARLLVKSTLRNIPHMMRG